MSTSSYTQRSNTSRRSLSNLQITSTGLSHTVQSIDDTKAVVVIDIGRKLTKCGYSGESTPRTICRTQYYDDNYILRSDVLDGCNNGRKPNYGALLRFFKYIFYNYLLVEPRERRVVIVENVLYPSEFRNALCKVLFEKLDVPSILFIPGHLCATFPFNTENAFVVELGYKETVMMPVADGVTMLYNLEVTRTGAQSLEEKLEELLSQHGKIENCDGELRNISKEEIVKIKDKHLIEDICTRLLLCTTRERGVMLQMDPARTNPKIKDGRIPFGCETLIVPGFIRESCCEIFFTDEKNNEPALPALIFSVISKLSLDLRKKMFSSLLISGGPTLIRGFLPRLKEELEELGRFHNSKATTDIKFFIFENQGTGLYISWLGASMFSSIRDALSCRSVSRQSWLDEGVLPDWTDFVQHNIPCGRTNFKG